MSGQSEGLNSLLAVLDAHVGIPLEDTDEAEESFERLLRAGLERNVSTATANKALAVLRDEGLLDPAELADTPARDLDALFRTNRLQLTPRTLGPIQKLAAWFQKACPDGDLTQHATSELRSQWRRINGLGPATVDGLLLAIGRASYPIDRASFRIFARHGWVDSSMDEDEARTTFEALAPGDALRLARLSAQLEQVARDFCKASRACCESCPLRPLLPASGPVGLDDV